MINENVVNMRKTQTCRQFLYIIKLESVGKGVFKDTPETSVPRLSFGKRLIGLDILWTQE